MSGSRACQHGVLLSAWCPSKAQSICPIRGRRRLTCRFCGQDDEAGSEETRFQLPAMPSPGVMMLLLAAGRELQRAGGSTAGSTALEVLEWDLGAATLHAFQWVPFLLELVWACMRAYPALQ